MDTGTLNSIIITAVAAIVASIIVNFLYGRLKRPDGQENQKGGYGDNLVELPSGLKVRVKVKDVSGNKDITGKDTRILKEVISNSKTGPEAQKLTDLLLSFPSMLTMESRNEILSQLPVSIGDSIVRSNVAKEDVSNIVRTLLFFPNGIEALVDVLRRYERDTPAWEQLEEFLKTLPKEMPP